MRIEPEAFYYDDNAPDRLMGIESELDVRTPKGQDDMAFGKKLMSREVVERAGLNHYKSGNTAWFSNGMKGYIDMGHPEICTGESLGPRDATVSQHAIPHLLEELTSQTPSSSRIYNRSATVKPDSGDITTKGFHPNLVTPTDAIQQEDIGTLETHLVTQIFAWGGIVTKQGFNISPKSRGIAGGINTIVSQRTGEGKKCLGILYSSASSEDDTNAKEFGFSRFEDRSKTPGLPWSDFMGLATTSLLMRVLERPDMAAERAELRKYNLENPVGAFQAIGEDLTFKNIYETREKGRMTVVGIARAIADIVGAACARLWLPDDEYYATGEWQSVLDDFCDIQRRKAELDVLLGRVGWSTKYVDICKHFKVRKLRDPTIQMLGRCLTWDRVAPAGLTARLTERQQPLGITPEELRSRAFTPPATRALARATHIQKTPDLEVITWSSIKRLGEDPQFMHPYETEALAA